MSVEQVPPQVDQESVEIDDFLDNSMGGTSFLFYNGEVEWVQPSVLRFHWLSDPSLSSINRAVGKEYFAPL